MHLIDSHLIDSHLIDSHCHLDFDCFADDIDEVLEGAYRHSVRHFIVPGVARRYWSRQIQFYNRHQNIHLAFGLHPCFLDEYNKGDLAYLEQLIQTHNIVAIGECGLDSSMSNMPLQQQVFLAQIQLANRYSKPLIIHHRRSHHLILSAFKQQPPQHGGIIHAFSGSQQDAKKYIDLGFKLGCGGGITYPRANKTRAVFQNLPLEDIVLETDSPDMPLWGYQGQRNTPDKVLEVAKSLAELKGCDFNTIAKQTSENLERLFANEFLKNN